MTVTAKTKRKIPTVAEVSIDQKKQFETNKALAPVSAAPVPASNGAAPEDLGRPGRRSA